MYPLMFMADLGSESIPSRAYRGVSTHRNRKKDHESMALTVVGKICKEAMLPCPLESNIRDWSNPQQAPSQTSHVHGNVRIVRETENGNDPTLSLLLREIFNTIFALIYNSLIYIWYYSFNLCVANVGLQNFYLVLGTLRC